MSLNAEDPFTVAPLRIMGYGCAIGTALRLRFCQDMKNGCYVVATTFVITHTLHKGFIQDSPGTIVPMIDTIIFESLASVTIPTYTTYYICRTSRSQLKDREAVPRLVYRWTPLLLGLTACYIMYEHLDPIVNKFLDRTIRVLYY